LEIGIEAWSDRIYRLKKEREYVQQYKDNLYNISGIQEIQIVSSKTNHPNQIRVYALGEKFSSINEAARAFGVSPSTIRNRLNNPKYPSFYCDDISRSASNNKSRAVVIDNEYFVSVGMASAQKGICEKTLRKNIRTKPNWNYFDELTPEQKAFIPKLEDNIAVAKSVTFKNGRAV
jgi:hypothetical protein